MAQQITKNTTDLKIGSVLKAIHIEDDAPFELNKFYKITDGDCVGTFEIGNAIAFTYSINELGDYFEHIASLDDIEDLEKKASILKETFEQIKQMSESAEDEISNDTLINEAIASLVQDEVFKGDEIELQFICDNMDITMVEKCSCCGTILLPDDEAYEDSLNDGKPLCEHCSLYDEDSSKYIKTIRQDVLENITGLRFSHLVGNSGSIVESFNHWLNENKYGFGISDDESKARFVEYLTEETELNICDICGLIEKSEDLNWSDENLFDEDYQNFRFLEGTNIGFDSICDDCLNKVGTISQPSLEDITTRIQENQMMHKVFDVVLLENVNFKERNIEKTTVVGEICYMDFEKKTYKLKEFGEHEFKDEDFFDILNLAYVNEYVSFMSMYCEESISRQVDEWSFVNWEGTPDIDYAFENFGYKEEFIEHLKSNDLPYGRFLTPKFNIGDEFQVHFNYYEDNEFTTHKIIEIDTTFAEADEIVYWSEEYVFITESELSRQKNPSSEFNEVLIVKDEVIHQIFCQDSGSNDTVVPTYNELIAAGEILDTWQICEEFQDYCYKSIVNKVNELCEEYFTISEAIIYAKKDTQKLKKYSIRQVVEYGVTIEIIEALQRLHKMSDNKELNDNKEIIVLQANISTQDISSIEIVLDCDINYIALSKYLKNEVGQSLYKDINMLVAVIKEAKYDKHNTLHLYDC